jgi:alkylhydroperoxidase family enzyme
MPPRIAPLEQPWPDDVAEVLASMMPPGVPPLGLFRTLAHNPRVLRKVRDANLLDRGSLARRDRELVILRTCARCGSEYEWGVHARVFAERVGLSEPEVVGSVHAAAEDPRWDERGRALVSLVDALHDTGRVPDRLWDQLRRLYGDEQLVELVVLVGFYHAISFVTRAFEIDLEAAGRRWPAPEAHAPVPAARPPARQEPRRDAGAAAARRGAR